MARIEHNTLRLIAGGFYFPDAETVKQMAQEIIDNRRNSYIESAARVYETAWEAEEMIREYDRTHAVGFVKEGN